MNDIIEKKQIKDYTIEIELDPDPISPRDDYYFADILAGHNEYSFGEHQIKRNDYPQANSIYEDFLFFIKDHFNLKNKSLNTIESWVNKNLLYFPLYIYEHGGIALSTSPFSCKWDSGQLGYTFVTKDKIRNELNVKNITSSVEEEVKKRIDSEIETYNSYINGEVYAYVIYDKDGEGVDSCCGFYDVEEAIEDATNVVQSYLPILNYFQPKAEILEQLGLNNKTVWLNEDELIKKYNLTKDQINIYYEDEIKEKNYYVEKLTDIAKWTFEKSKINEKYIFPIINFNKTIISERTEDSVELKFYEGLMYNIESCQKSFDQITYKNDNILFEREDERKLRLEKERLDIDAAFEMEF